MSASPPVGGRPAKYHDDTTSQPPWEQRSVGQVPYMSPATSPSAQALQRAASHDYEIRQRSYSSSYNHNDGQGSASYGHPTPPESTNAWRVNTPLTAPPFTGPRPPPLVPYESVGIPQAPRSAPNVPSFGKIPPSPPDSFNSCRSTNKTMGEQSRRLESPPLPRQPSANALPSTMSATMSTRQRDRTPSRHRTAASGRDRREGQREPEPLSFVKRWKLRLKDMFKREPIDETEFERIEDRHWADD